MHSAAVIGGLDALKDIRLGMQMGLINPMSHQFGFEDVKSTLHGRIFPAIASAVHAAYHAVEAQRPLIISARVLTAPVRVMNQSSKLH